MSFIDSKELSDRKQRGNRYRLSTDPVPSPTGSSPIIGEERIFQIIT